MSDLDDILARLPPRPRVSTGFPMLDAVLGGGFPEGLTVIVCDGQTAYPLVSRWVDRLCREPRKELRLTVWTGDGDDAADARRRALLEWCATALLRRTHRSGYAPFRDDEREADVLLWVVAEGCRLTVEARKNERRPRFTVRFDVALDGSMAERDVVPAADE